MKIDDLIKETEASLGHYGPDADLYLQRLIDAYKQIKIMGNFIARYSAEGVDTFGFMIQGQEIVRNLKKELGLK